MTATFLDTLKEIRIKLPAILEASELFDDDIVARLETLADMDLSLINNDLSKGNYLGNRKIDIDIALNNLSEETECSYKSITLVLNNGITHKIDFTAINEIGDTVVDEVVSYTGLYTKFINGIEAYNANEANPQLHIVNYEIDVINETIAELPTMLRIRDTDGSACNIDRITLEYYNGGSPIEYNPSYYWTKTTSALQVLANRVGDIIALGENIDKIIALSDKEDEIQYLYDVRAKIQDIHDNITALLEVHANLDNINSVNLNEANINTVADDLNLGVDSEIVKVNANKTNIDDVSANENNINSVVANKTNIDAVANNETNINSVSTNINSINAVANNKTNIDAVANNETNINNVASNEADINTVVANLASINLNATNILDIQNAFANAQTTITKSEEAKAIRNELVNLSTLAVTLIAGSSATVSYNSSTGLLTFGIPQGAKGDRGEAFSVDAIGTIEDRASYNNQPFGFTYLSTNESPNKIYFKLSSINENNWSIGSPFGQGETGVGISSIDFTSSTGGAGAGVAGETDTYTITYTDSSTSTFNVVNGAIPTASDIGLGNVDNTADMDKPISTATQTALNLKANTVDVNTSLNTKINKSSIVSTLTSTDDNSVLAASQGPILKGLIDNINTILTSDDTTLDEIQELVNYIKQNRSDLDALGISNIAGLVDALASKANLSGATFTGAIHASKISFDTVNLKNADTDFNTLTTSGFYNLSVTNASTFNAPLVGWFYLEVFTHSQDPTAYCMQIATQLTQIIPRRFIRTKVGGAWGNWIELLKEADIGTKVLAPDGDGSQLTNLPDPTGRKLIRVQGTKIGISTTTIFTGSLNKRYKILSVSASASVPAHNASTWMNTNVIVNGVEVASASSGNLNDFAYTYVWSPDFSDSIDTPFIDNGIVQIEIEDYSFLPYSCSVTYDFIIEEENN